MLTAKCKPKSKLLTSQWWKNAEGKKVMHRIDQYFTTNAQKVT